MKILHISADWKWTGPAEPMVNAIASLRARGHHVDLACATTPAGSGGALVERAAERGIEPVHILSRGQGYLPLRDALEVRRLRRFLRASQYDVVHAHHTRDHLLAYRALRRLPARLVLSWHHGEPVPASPWGRWLYGPRRLVGLVLLSESLARGASERLGWPAERLAVAPGSVDGERFQPREPLAAVREELGLKPGERIVGVVARMQPHRRFDLLLEAFRRAREQAPELRLLVVGRGTRARQVMDEPVRALGLGDAVVRAGYRRGDYRDVLALMDALVFLVPGSDGSCRAVLETMAMEIPTVASRRGLLPEIVQDGETGVLVDETPDSLAAALVDVGHHPARWRDRGRAARQRALSHHPLTTLGSTLESLYQRLTAEPPRG